MLRKSFGEGGPLVSFGRMGDVGGLLFPRNRRTLRAMRMRSTLAVFLFAVCTAHSVPTVDPLAGKVHKGVYSNSFFGFSVAVPEKWKTNLTVDWRTISNDDQRRELRAI